MRHLPCAGHCHALGDALPPLCPPDMAYDGEKGLRQTLEPAQEASSPRPPPSSCLDNVGASAGAHS